MAKAKFIFRFWIANDAAVIHFGAGCSKRKHRNNWEAVSDGSFPC